MLNITLIEFQNLLKESQGFYQIDLMVAAILTNIFQKLIKEFTCRQHSNT